MQAELALERQARLVAGADRAARRAAILWQKRMQGQDFDIAWAGVGPQVSAIAEDAQVFAAAGASAYLARTARADGVPTAGVSPVQPGAFAGADASGRTLAGLLYGAVTTAKLLVGRGAGIPSALTAGGTYLSTMVRTATLDTGRSADLTASTAHRYTEYVRVVSGGACSRCAVLAGTASARDPFLRHPGCRCTSAPVTREGRTLAASSRYASPESYFESLAPAEQERIFTRAGAEAIRAGADPVAVVSARRGAVGIDYSRSVLSGRTLPNSGRRLERSVIGRRPDGTPILGYVTGEGSTVRGALAQRGKAAGLNTQRLANGRTRMVRRVRLMPETIVDLTPDVELRRVLLRDAGYLDVPISRSDRTTADWVRRRQETTRSDRVIADRFYREHGIALGGSS